MRARHRRAGSRPDHSGLESCGDRRAILEWDVIRERKGRRTADLDFRGRTVGTPVKPVAVVVQRPGLTRRLAWRRINASSYSFRRRRGGQATLTAVYVENRSRYRGEGARPPGVLPDLGALPDPLEVLPTPELPGVGAPPTPGDLLPGDPLPGDLPELPGLPPLEELLPGLPSLLGSEDPTGRFVSDLCLRTLVRRVR